MDESIYEKNRQLQRKLDHLIKQARANEKNRNYMKLLVSKSSGPLRQNNCAIYYYPKP